SPLPDPPERALGASHGSSTGMSCQGVVRSPPDDRVEAACSVALNVVGRTGISNCFLSDIRSRKDQAAESSGEVGTALQRPQAAGYKPRHTLVRLAGSDLDEGPPPCGEKPREAGRQLAIGGEAVGSAGERQRRIESRHLRLQKRYHAGRDI